MIRHSRKNQLNIDTDSESSSKSSDDASDDIYEFMPKPKKEYLVQLNNKVLDQIVDK